MISKWILGFATVLVQVRSQIAPQAQNFWGRPFPYPIGQQPTQPTPIPIPQARFPQMPNLHMQHTAWGTQPPPQPPPQPQPQPSQPQPQPLTPPQSMYPNFNQFNRGAMAAHMTPHMQPAILQNAARPRHMPAANTGPMPGCVPTFYQPRLCQVNGESQHKYTLQAVMRMVGDKNIEKIGQCVQGIQHVNCADYNAAQYIWQKGYCYCKRYHTNLSQFMGMPPLRCVLNSCGGCSQEFYIGKSRIVDCD